MSDINNYVKIYNFLMIECISKLLFVDLLALLFFFNFCLLKMSELILLIILNFLLLWLYFWLLFLLNYCLNFFLMLFYPFLFLYFFGFCLVWYPSVHFFLTINWSSQRRIITVLYFYRCVKFWNNLIKVYLSFNFLLFLIWNRTQVSWVKSC